MRNVKLEVTDSPSADLVGAVLYGTVTHVFYVASLGSKVARVALEKPITPSQGMVSAITILPRHRRRGFWFARFFPVAVYAIDVSDMPTDSGRDQRSYWSRVFAIALLREARGPKPRGNGEGGMRP